MDNPPPPPAVPAAPPAAAPYAWVWVPWPPGAWGQAAPPAPNPPAPPPAPNPPAPNPPAPNPPAPNSAAPPAPDPEENLDPEEVLEEDLEEDWEEDLEEDWEEDWEEGRIDAAAAAVTDFGAAAIAAALTRVSRLCSLRANGLRFTPDALLDTRRVDQNGSAVLEVLVRWQNLPIEDATWEDFTQLQQSFPDLKLEDKLPFDGPGIDGHTSRRSSRPHVPNRRYQ